MKAFQPGLRADAARETMQDHESADRIAVDVRFLWAEYWRILHRWRVAAAAATALSVGAVAAWGLLGAATTRAESVVYVSESSGTTPAGAIEYARQTILPGLAPKWSVDPSVLDDAVGLFNPRASNLVVISAVSSSRLPDVQQLVGAIATALVDHLAAADRVAAAELQAKLVQYQQEQRHAEAMRDSWTARLQSLEQEISALELTYSKLSPAVSSIAGRGESVERFLLASQVVDLLQMLSERKLERAVTGPMALSNAESQRALAAARAHGVQVAIENFRGSTVIREPAARTRRPLGVRGAVILTLGSALWGLVFFPLFLDWFRRSVLKPPAEAAASSSPL